MRTNAPSRRFSVLLAVLLAAALLLTACGQSPQEKVLDRALTAILTAPDEDYVQLLQRQPRRENSLLAPYTEEEQAAYDAYQAETEAAYRERFGAYFTEEALNEVYYNTPFYTLHYYAAQEERHCPLVQPHDVELIPDPAGDRFRVQVDLAPLPEDEDVELQTLSLTGTVEFDEENRISQLTWRDSATYDLTQAYLNYGYDLGYYVFGPGPHWKTLPLTITTADGTEVMYDYTWKYCLNRTWEGPEANWDYIKPGLVQAGEPVHIRVELPEEGVSGAVLFRMETKTDAAFLGEGFAKVDVDLSDDEADFVPEFWNDGEIRYILGCTWDDCNTECHYLFAFRRE